MFAVPLAATAIFSTVAQAQQITTEINGQVSDAAGAPLANATVVVTDTRTGATSTHHHQRAGRVRRAQPVDRRSLHRHRDRAQLPGPDGQRHHHHAAGRDPAQLHADRRVGRSRVGHDRRHRQPRPRHPARRPAPAPRSAPKCSRTRRPSTATSATSSASIRASASTATTCSGQDRISCLGGNDRGNAFTVDGIAQSDVYGLNDTGFSSRSSTPLPYDAIRETQVQFAPFDVEYGQFTGCAINVVTKRRHQPVPRRRLLRIFQQRPARRPDRRPARSARRLHRQALGRLARRPGDQGPPVPVRRL